MAKVMCSLDTETGTIAVTHDGNTINAKHFTMGSYYGEPSGPGDDLPQYAYFSYSKEIEPGVTHNIQGNFQLAPAVTNTEEKGNVVRLSSYCLAKEIGRIVEQSKAAVALAAKFTDAKK